MKMPFLSLALGTLVGLLLPACDGVKFSKEENSSEKQSAAAEDSRDYQLEDELLYDAATNEPKHAGDERTDRIFLILQRFDLDASNTLDRAELKALLFKVKQAMVHHPKKRPKAHAPQGPFGRPADDEPGRSVDSSESPDAERLKLFDCRDKDSSGEISREEFFDFKSALSCLREKRSE